MTFGSLFSGIGGIDLGLERAGLECKFQVEIDPFCRKVLEKHWPDVKRYGDINELDGNKLESVDLLAGGFPCQDLSQAGKRIGIDGSRSGLWFEFARLIGELRPRFVLIENVPGLLVPGAMPRVVGELARLGYVGLWLCLRASDFGASHIRKRVFLVAYSECSSSRTGFGASQKEPELRRQRSGDGCQSAMANASNGFLSQPWRGSKGRDGAGSASAIFPHTSKSRLPLAERCELSGEERYDKGRATSEFHRAPLPFAPGPSDHRWSKVIAERPDLAPAIEATAKPPLCGVADGVSNWMDRAMRDRTKRLSRLGNAVVPEIAEWIGRRIVEFDA